MNQRRVKVKYRSACYVYCYKNRSALCTYTLLFLGTLLLHKNVCFAYKSYYFSFRIKFTSSVRNFITIKVSLMNHSHDQLKYLKNNFACVVIDVNTYISFFYFYQEVICYSLTNFSHLKANEMWSASK